MSRLDLLHASLEPQRSALLGHALYRRLDSLPALRAFMEHHVFAVWDFMSLLKALQRRFTGVGVPWVPPAHPLACRFVNEIVLAEESDDDGRGGFASHFELYRRAMPACGAGTGPIDAFLHALRQGRPVAEALASAPAPGPASRFVRRTFALIDEGDPVAIASSFAFGREELLPEVFRQLLDAAAGDGLEGFRHYLDRHIGLDEDEHGPMAGKLVELLCGDDEGRWRTAGQAAARSLEARQDLWDGTLAAINRFTG